MRQTGINQRLGLIRKSGQRQAHLVRTQTQTRHRVFGTDQARLDKDRLVQRHQPILQRQRFAIVTRSTCRLHLGQQFRGHIGGHRNRTHTAAGVERMGGGIFARQLDELRTAGDAGIAHAGQISGGILHTHNTGQFGQLAHRLGRHVDDGPTGDVIDDDRNIGAIVQRREMGNQPALRRFVIIGCHHQRAIGAHLLGKLNKAHRLNGVVGPCPGNHRHAACSGLDHCLNHRLMFLMGQRWAFARGANGDKTAGALTDMPFDQLLEGFQIQSAVTKRRYEGRHRTFKHLNAPFLRVAGKGPGVNRAYACIVS
mmetsp:Transcript_27421/g.50473  ORF Transcript_27421/g.50473 Transcript_27421/m.50473 type:complete len:311 (-) Transcript_27421:14-946(-)